MGFLNFFRQVDVGRGENAVREKPRVKRRQYRRERASDILASVEFDAL